MGKKILMTTAAPTPKINPVENMTFDQQKPCYAFGAFAKHAGQR